MSAMASIVGFLSFLGVAWQFVKPPKHVKQTNRDLYDWLVRHAILDLGTMGAMLIFVLWAIGAFAGIGLAGYANANDVTALTQRIEQSEVVAQARGNEVKALLLEMQLSQLREKQCYAQQSTPAQVTAARVLEDLIGQKRREYWVLTGRTYDVGMCF